MTKKSLFLIGTCAVVGAVSAMRRRAVDVQAQAARETAECERLLRRLGAQTINFR
jgi:hypothetical protein